MCRKVNLIFQFKGLILGLILIIFAIPCQAQQPVGCFSSTGASKACGESWPENKDGEPYICTCNCSMIPPYDCSPTGSPGSSGGSSNGNSSISPYPIDNFNKGKATLSNSEVDELQNWWKELSQRINTLGPGTDESINYRNSSGDEVLDRQLKKDADTYKVQLLRSGDRDMTKLVTGKGEDQSVQLLRKPEERKAIKVVPVPPLPESEKKPDHYITELVRGGVVTLIGAIPVKNSLITTGGILITNLIAEDIKAGMDCFGYQGTEYPCPSTSKIIQNSLKQSTLDVAENLIGSASEKAIGSGLKYGAKADMILHGVSPGIAFISETPKKLGELGVNTYKVLQAGKDGYDFGKNASKVWGKIKEEPK